MTAWDAGGNYWVNASVEDWLGARKTPESVRRRYKQKPYCQKRVYHLVHKKEEKKTKKSDKRRGRATVS